MTVGWHFKEREPGDTTRDPISGEFFATEAIRDSAEALVREGIQNSLDAAEGGQCRVRIALGEVLARDATPYLGGLRAHLDAPRNGLRADSRPTPVEPCRYIAFEDFGTLGLQGDPLQWHHVHNVRNGFYAFFRAEGETDKGTNDKRGRWGIGKFVFPRASRASVFFGLTIPAGTRAALLLGRSILKSHQVASTYYVPDGYFGIPTPITSRGSIIAPDRDASRIAAFARTFNLTRNDEPGLSLVVPWRDEEITFDRVVSACIRDWYFSILRGELRIEVVERQRVRVLDASTLDVSLKELDPRLAMEIAPLLHLVKRHLEGSPDCGTEPVDVVNAPRWPVGPLSQESLTMVRDRLDRDEAVAISVSIPVRAKQQPQQDGHFEIILKRDQGADDGRPTFIREGIVVSDAKGARVRGVRSIVVAGRGPLADLLGDAENPAHTEWRQDTANFKDKYTYGPGYLKFVKNAVHAIAEQLDSEADDRAPDLLLNYFWLPLPEGRPRAGRTRPTHEPGPTPPVVGPLPPPRQSRFRVTSSDGGFLLSANPEAAAPEYIDVSAAYDVRRGNAFSKHSASDFQFLKDITFKHAGLRLEEKTNNSMRVRVLAPNYHLRAEGFDVNRDVIVRAVARGEFNDDS